MPRRFRVGTAADGQDCGMWFDDAGDLARVLAVGAGSYAVVVAVLRVSGKRTLAKLTAFDLVVTVAFGSVLSAALLSPSTSFAEAAVAFVLLAAAQYLVASLSSRVRWVGRLVRAEPTALVVRGRVHGEALHRERVSLANVRAAIRQSGASRLADVAAVVLETDGSLSVVGSASGEASALEDVRGWPDAPRTSGGSVSGGDGGEGGRQGRADDRHDGRRTSVHVRDMLRTYPRDFNVDLELLARTVETLEDCANTCGQCADACLSEPEPGPLAKCIRLNLDCAALCRALSGILSRQTDYDANVTTPALEACIAACRSCGDECARHGEHMEHCRVCADVCRSCEQACRELLAAMQ